VTRYARLLLIQLRTSIVLAAQYRADFLLDGLIEIVWVSTALAPLLVAFQGRAAIAGWSFGEALSVLGFFTLLAAVLEGAINPSLVAVVQHIRKGTLDFVLLKPADAQFLVSTARFYPWRSINAVTALGLFVLSFRALGRVPRLADCAVALVFFASAVTALYSLWLLVVCTAFHAVKIDNAADLMTAVFDAARWPSSVFRGAVRFVVTFVVPLALMTTVPARALLGHLDTATVVAAIAGTVSLAALSRWAWIRSLAAYTSASS
jgi:ABC-2 type transport system permease protein